MLFVTVDYFAFFSCDFQQFFFFKIHPCFCVKQYCFTLLILLLDSIFCVHHLSVDGHLEWIVPFFK
jgi:hypothetical protein